MAKSEPKIESLPGLWRRSLIHWPDGRRDTTTWVNWLQGPRFYIDLRQEAGRPDFRGVANLRALGAEQVGWLAGQEGFAGELHYADGYFEWAREIDFQPQAIYSDQGRLRMEDGVMVEEGKDIPYIEHWHREPLESAPVAALRLDDPSAGTRAYAVRVGPLFMYARSRAIGVPSGQHLKACVDEAGSLSEAQDLVDCEISQGVVVPSGWLITRSSLPFREGQRLDPVPGPRGRDSIVMSDMSAEGKAFTRHWTILEAQGSVGAFASASGLASAG